MILCILRIWETREVHLEKPAGKGPLGRPSHRLMANIKVNLKYGSFGMEWIDLEHDREKWQSLENGVMNFRFLTRSFLHR
jgi:hypothetical protein